MPGFYATGSELNGTKGPRRGGPLWPVLANLLLDDLELGPGATRASLLPLCGRL